MRLPWSRHASTGTAVLATARDPNDPAPQPTADDLRWEKEALDGAHASLATAQARADSWSKSISALLGAFGLVAFIKGPEAIKDIPTTSSRYWPWDGATPINPAFVVVVLIFGAALLLTAAIWMISRAAQGTLIWADYVDGPRLQNRTRVATQDAIRKMGRSRRFTLLSAALFFGALGVAWLSQFDKKDAATQSAIVSTATAAMCGKLGSASDGSLEITPEGEAPAKIGGGATITLVASCPTKP